MASPPISVFYCWYCPRVFDGTATRSRHMSTAHKDKSRLVPPPGWNNHPVGAGTSADAAWSVKDGTPPPLVDTESGELWIHDEAEDGMERGSLLPAESAHPVAVGSVSSRIRAFYQSLPEAGQAVPCVEPSLATVPSVFNTSVLMAVLAFVVTAGGTGLCQSDQLALAKLLILVTSPSAGSTSPSLPLFSNPHALVTAIASEEKRVLATKQWMQVDIVEGNPYVLYFRDVLQACLDDLRAALVVDLDGGPLENSEGGERRRSHTLNADLFLKEREDVRRLHGDAAHVLGVLVHVDEARVSWNGGNLVCPARVRVVNVLRGGGGWLPVGYVPHIPKVVGNGRNARARLAVSDARNSLLQRCLAVMFDKFTQASEHGVLLDLPTRGPVFLVPRVLGLVADQVAERALLGLMGNQSTFNCTHCLARRESSCDLDCPAARPRPVISTLEAQLQATAARIADGRPRSRVALARAMSALPFVPALGAVHGLGTGGTNLYRIVSFDVLHVWKLGILRLLAQRLPAMLEAVSEGGMALHGTVQETLDVVNERSFELGRLCRASPAPPGPFVPVTVTQATMTGRQWRHFCPEWPHMVAGLFGPATLGVSGTANPGSPASVRRVMNVPVDEVEPMMMDDEEGEDDAVQSPGPGLTHSASYRALFSCMPLEDAVLQTFCLAAKMNGLLLGDNTADTAVMTQSQAEAIAELGRHLARCMQVVLGPTHTTKVHRMMHHLLAELEHRGNLWEGDTSENESLHSSCKQMFRRSNKHGPTLLLQLLRADETRSDVLRGQQQAESSAAAAVDEPVGEPEVEVDGDGHRLGHRRGVRVGLASVAARPGLAAVASCLGVDEDAILVLANTLRVRATFEWGSSGVDQLVRGADSFRGTPWHSHVRYTSANGETSWGLVRLVIRCVNEHWRDRVVVQCMRPAAARSGCVLTAFGCRRLAWDFAQESDEWPRLAVVDVSAILRLEQVHVDWQDLVARLGIRAMPSKMPRTAEERRCTRFFVNSFYPWTSRGQRVLE